MSADEPDETPVTREHVAVFLKWYRERTAVPKYSGIDEQWWSGLHTLNLGQLRQGMRRYEKMPTHPYIEPPAFWALCRAPTDAAHDRLFRQMRETLRVAPRRRDKGDE